MRNSAMRSSDMWSVGMRSSTMRSVGMSITRKIISVVCAVLAAVLLYAVCVRQSAVLSGAAAASETPGDWRLILVNSSHTVPKDYEVTLLELSNGQSIDERIYPELQRMFDDARAEGFSLTVREGYRSRREQEDIMKQRISEYKAQGYSGSEAKRLAEELVAIPGTSEHELGIAVDINATGDTDQWELYGWLADNSWKYGFILRYPQDREDVTGITYEPWHYRYVGAQAAGEIYQRQTTLEEYLAAAA